MGKLRTTKRVQTLITAVAKGYSVSKDGLTVTNPTGRELKQHKKYSGNALKKHPYMHVSLGSNSDGSRFPLPVHMIQAYQKFGEEALHEGIVVRHKDENPLNNEEGNILIGSPHDNAMDRTPEARQAHAERAASFQRSLSTRQVRALRKAAAKGVKQKALCEKYGIAKGTCSDIINRKQYKDVD
jgi:hypothetical protein